MPWKSNSPSELAWIILGRRSWGQQEEKEEQQQEDRRKVRGWR
jgi:hypothetical protein